MRRSILWSWLVTVMLAAVLAACGTGGDTSVYVRNDSARAWLLVTTQGVVKVEPGADGLAASWSGGPGRPFWLKAPDCVLVGQFHRGEDGVYTVDGVPGFTARIEDHGVLFATFAEGTAHTEDCGGFTPR